MVATSLEMNVRSRDKRKSIHHREKIFLEKDAIDMGRYIFVELRVICKHIDLAVFD